MPVVHISDEAAGGEVAGLGHCPHSMNFVSFGGRRRRRGEDGPKPLMGDSGPVAGLDSKLRNS